MKLFIIDTHPTWNCTNVRVNWFCVTHNVCLCPASQLHDSTRVTDLLLLPALSSEVMWKYRIFFFFKEGLINFEWHFVMFSTYHAGKATDLLFNYFAIYGQKPVCYRDLKQYLDLVPSEEQNSFIQSLLDTVQLEKKDDDQIAFPTDVSWLSTIYLWNNNTECKFRFSRVLTSV